MAWSAHLFYGARLEDVVQSEEQLEEIVESLYEDGKVLDGFLEDIYEERFVVVPNTESYYQHVTDAGLEPVNPELPKWSLVSFVELLKKHNLKVVEPKLYFGMVYEL